MIQTLFKRDLTEDEQKSWPDKDDAVIYLRGAFWQRIAADVIARPLDDDEAEDFAPECR